MVDNKNTIRVAAIQMCAELGEVEINLARAERLVREAFEQGARWAVLPEFFTSAVGFHPKLLDAARLSDGEPFQLSKLQNYLTHGRAGFKSPMGFGNFFKWDGL